MVYTLLVNGSLASLSMEKIFSFKDERLWKIHLWTWMWGVVGSWMSNDFSKWHWQGYMIILDLELTQKNFIWTTFIHHITAHAELCSSNMTISHKAVTVTQNVSYWTLFSLETLFFWEGKFFNFFFPSPRLLIRYYSNHHRKF